MKFICLRRDEQGKWEHLGPQSAVEVPDLTDEDPGRILEHEAVEMVGLAGVFLPIPFDRWLLFEAEAQVTVKPVLRRVEIPARTARPGEIEAEDDAAGEPRDDDDEARLDSDLDGLTQGPKRS
jgi:hypothetical protein